MLSKDEHLWKVFSLCYLFEARLRISWGDVPSNLNVNVKDWVTALRITLSSKEELSNIFLKNLTLRLSALILRKLEDKQVINYLSDRLLLSGKEKSYLLKINRIFLRKVST